MTTPRSRRAFLGDVTQLSAAAAIVPGALHVAHADLEGSPSATPEQGTYDLSWTRLLEDATDRLLVDSTGIAEGFSMQISMRFLDNCDATYGAGRHQARVVHNWRTGAIAMGFNDAMWAKYGLGAEYRVKARGSEDAATANPFLDLPPGQPEAVGSINVLRRRGAVFLICDFATGHLCNRLAPKLNTTADAIHRDLAANLVPNAFLVPSGIFGLAKAQNLGCAFTSA